MLISKRLAYLVAICVCLVTAYAQKKTASATQIVHLRCDYLVNPLGLDDPAPRFSWEMSTARFGAAQRAYQVMVSLSAADLERPANLLWDSGRVESNKSVGIVYGGPKLQSSRRYYWTVRVWDELGQVKVPTQPAWWEMGLLDKTQWVAQWITGESDEERQDRLSVPKWIWNEGEDALRHASAGDHLFQLRFDLPADPVTATLFVAGKDTVSVSENGIELLRADSVPSWGPMYAWGTFKKLDALQPLHKGSNHLLLRVHTPGGLAGLCALLRVQLRDGQALRFVTDRSWLSQSSQAGKMGNATGDDSWHPVEIVGEMGETPLGTPWPPASARLLKRDFEVHQPITSARLYITALGAYRASINGQRIGKQILSPGWTDYHKDLYYQVYDVSASIHPGKNTIGALLGDGWYGSGLFTNQTRYNFGPPPLRLIAQLILRFKDGTTQTVATDSSWQAAESPVLSSDIYNGETYDARREQTGWNKPEFHSSGWWKASLADVPMAQLRAQNFQPIEEDRELTPVAITHPSPDVYVFDMGQNMVGTERLRFRGKRGTTVTLRFAEVLQPDGNIYAANMRTAKETDTYTLRGDGEEEFTPHFTYHGYRYVEVRNYPGVPTLASLRGIVFHTAAPQTMKFSTGNAMVNQLWSNILWGQWGNFESIPTDCPQRDERLGWMGDAQVFWRTASYNADLSSFSEKFGLDMRTAQSPEGNYSDVTPRSGTVVGEGSPGWAEAGIVIPYTAARQYGDDRIIRDNAAAMARYLDQLKKNNPDLVNHRVAYGDWLAIGSSTPQDLIGTAYWAYDASLMASMMKVLGKNEEAESYHRLFEQLRDSFNTHFVMSDGSVGSRSETSYVLALRFGLLSEKLRKEAAEKLVKDIEAHGWHLTTGFLGTPYLLSVLSDTGHSDVAYRLLLQSTFPSWGYMVNHGATTMWERWNGDQMLNDPGMNSFNHYAYGSVAEWFYRYVAGIDLLHSEGTFQHFWLHPQFSPSIGSAGASYDSVYGPIESRWKYGIKASDGRKTVEWIITIPANTEADVTLPYRLIAEARMNGEKVAASRWAAEPDDSLEQGSMRLSAGTYRFVLQVQ